MPRQKALRLLWVAGAENDKQAFMRLYTENRVSLAAAQAAFRAGAKAAAALTKK